MSAAAPREIDALTDTLADLGLVRPRIDCSMFKPRHLVRDLPNAQAAA